MRQQWELLLQQGVSLPLLLTPEQERRVWRESQPEQLQQAQGFLRLGDLVDHAMRASRLFYLWREEGDSFLPLLSDTHLEEIELFALWQAEFELRCEAEQWLQGARLAEQVGLQIAHGVIQLPQRVEHYMLQQWNRSEQQLLEQLRGAGVTVDEYRLPALRSEQQVVEALEPQHEIELAASHIFTHLQLHPTERIGVVVLELRTRRAQIESVFSEVAVPATATEAVPPSQLPYRISCGQALLDDPRIHHALQLLKLAQQGLPLLEAAALLRSPWLLLGAEMEVRSICELQLWRQGVQQVSLKRLQQLPLSPRFQGALQALSELDLQQPAQTHHWAERFTHALAFFEWAENGEQSPVSFAAYNGWREGVDRFVALDEWVGTIDGRQALAELRQVLSGIELDLGRSAKAVEVLTPEEADGIQFDRLWVMGCDDMQWPQEKRLSPFLPQEWQRKQVPRVDQLHAQQQSRAQLERLKQSATVLFFSYSASEAAGAEAERSLTPLLGVVTASEMEYQPPKSWWSATDDLALESIEDQAVALPLGSAVRGGSSLLANQSQCPFRGFVRHRLQAEPMEQVRSGLDARERGTLLHELLERCWREIGCSAEALQKLDTVHLQSMVQKIAAGTVEQFRDTHQERMGPRFAENEHQRLSLLALRALELDRQRESAFVIEEMERQHQIELGGLTLSIKMDRVDQLEDGRRILIDYKSGKVNRAEWEGERPRAPQLPLYAMLLEQVAAVLYSQIRADEVLYKGEQEDETVLAGAEGGKRCATVAVSEDWQAQLQQWHQAVEALAVEFRLGVATVDPQQGQASCQYCGLEPLCRVEI